MEISSLNEIYSQIINLPDKELVEYLQSVNLVPTVFRCSRRTCRSSCTLRTKSKTNSLNAVFHCVRCRRNYSLLKKTFFENMRVSVRHVILLMWFWSCNVRSGCVADVISTVSRKVVLQQYRFFRDVCSWKLLQSDTHNLFRDLFIMGGPGHVIQINQTVICKRKHKGVMMDQWILIIYDITNKKGYIKYIEDAKSTTILPAIQNIVCQGSEIWTYNSECYQTLGKLGYNHKLVNHSKDLNLATNLNEAQAFGVKLKQFLRVLGVVASPFLNEYIDQFMWVQIYGKSPKMRFRNLTTQISEKYLF